MGKHLQYSLDKFNDLNGGILKEFIILENNLISFKIQNGVISENGINGIQASDLIKINMFLIESLNEDYSCHENNKTLYALRCADKWQEKRKKDRILRNVEGQNLP